MHLSRQMVTVYFMMLRRSTSHYLKALLACVMLAWPGSAVLAAPWSECLRAMTGMCFSTDHPASNQKIGVLVVINNRGDEFFCIHYLGQSRVGRVIRFEASYDDCGD